MCVEISGQRARIFHLFSGQLNIQVPTLPTTGPTPVQVILNCGSASESKSNAEMVLAQAAAPEFFYFARNSNGRNHVAAIDALTGGLIGLEGLIPGATFTPAKPRQVVSLFATGLGRTNPSFAPGVLPDGVAPTVERVVVTFDSFMGTMFPEILYAGVAPGLAGVYQVNVSIPDNAPDFDLLVRLRVGNFTSPAGAYLTVRR